MEHKDEIRNYVEDNGVLVAVCGGYQLLGKYYKLENETIEGLDILNIYTEQGKKRLIGNIVLENDFLNQKISIAVGALASGRNVIFYVAKGAKPVLADQM